MIVCWDWPALKAALIWVSRKDSGCSVPLLFFSLRCKYYRRGFWWIWCRDHFYPKSRRTNQCYRASLPSTSYSWTLCYLTFTIGFSDFLTTNDKFPICSFVFVIFKFKNRSLTSCSHQSSNCCLNISNEVILLSVSVIVKDIKSDILSRLKDVIDGKGLSKVWIEVVFLGFCFSEWCILFLGEVTLVWNFDVGIGLT